MQLSYLCVCLLFSSVNETENCERERSATVIKYDTDRIEIGFAYLNRERKGKLCFGIVYESSQWHWGGMKYVFGLKRNSIGINVCTM